MHKDLAPASSNVSGDAVPGVNPFISGEFSSKFTKPLAKNSFVQILRRPTRWTRLQISLTPNAIRLHRSFVTLLIWFVPETAVLPTTSSALITESWPLLLPSTLNAQRSQFYLILTTLLILLQAS